MVYFKCNQGTNLKISNGGNKMNSIYEECKKFNDSNVEGVSPFEYMTLLAWINN